MKFATFAEFYPFYLAEHRNRICRRLHFAGSMMVIAAIVDGDSSLATRGGLPSRRSAGYGSAWIGHFYFERNWPATFSHPFYSLLGDWVMFCDLLRGQTALLRSVYLPRVH